MLKKISLTLLTLLVCVGCASKQASSTSQKPAQTTETDQLVAKINEDLKSVFKDAVNPVTSDQVQVDTSDGYKVTGSYVLQIGSKYETKKFTYTFEKVGDKFNLMDKNIGETETKQTPTPSATPAPAPSATPTPKPTTTPAPSEEPKTSTSENLGSPRKSYPLHITSGLSLTVNYDSQDTFIAVLVDGSGKVVKEVVHQNGPIHNTFDTKVETGDYQLQIYYQEGNGYSIQYQLN